MSEHVHTLIYAQSLRAYYDWGGWGGGVVLGRGQSADERNAQEREPDVTHKMQISQHNDEIKAVRISTQDQDQQP